MSSSNAELDEKLRGLLKVMISRLPEGKRISAAVVQQLLRSKYPTVYPEEYIASHEAFIADTINTLIADREAAAATAAPPAKAAESSSSEEDESDDDDDDSDDEEDASDDEDEDDSDEEDDDAFDSDDDDDDEEDEDAGEPEKKKAREEEQLLLSKATAGTAEDVAERCKEMVSCLKKLNYRVRGPAENESLEDYLRKYLIGAFESHGMDPEKYSKSDVKRYKARREVELLQQDGASLGLDKRNRVGRGYAGVKLGNEGDGQGESGTAYKTSAFLDDE